MRFYLIPLGIVGVLVGLGFVFPQIANVRGSGSLNAGQLLLLLLGLVVTLGGVASAVLGVRLGGAGGTLSGPKP